MSLIPHDIELYYRNKKFLPSVFLNSSRFPKIGNGAGPGNCFKLLYLAICSFHQSNAHNIAATSPRNNSRNISEIC